MHMDTVVFQGINNLKNWYFSLESTRDRLALICGITLSISCQVTPTFSEHQHFAEVGKAWSYGEGSVPEKLHHSPLYVDLNAIDLAVIA